MQFVYILAGWEGSAHDGRVLSDAQSRQGFNTIKGVDQRVGVCAGRSQWVKSNVLNNLAMSATED